MLRVHLCIHRTDIGNGTLEFMAKDSQKIKKKTKTPRVTDKGWNSQNQLSGSVEKKKEEKTLVSSSKALTRFSSPIRLYSKVDVACWK